jgi:murein DD-endopeptidase MepM/ murein hydrolase activator NlpD
MYQALFRLRFLLFLSFLMLQHSCAAQPEKVEEVVEKTITVSEKYQTIFDKNPDYLSDGFDFPVGKPNGSGYYNAQGFGGKRHHLGDDWNGNEGGNNDLGHPIFAVSNGIVSEAFDRKGGWGKIVRIVHAHNGKFYESFYAHCNEMTVKKGDLIKRGQKIATIGNNDGMYLAHLHFEIRSEPDMPTGGGYSRDNTGYLDPTVFIKSNRPKK